MPRQLYLNASRIGERWRTCGLTLRVNAWGSSTSRRMMKAAISTAALSRNGIRQPQLLNASSGMK
ncbi:hypothetical protein D3C81_2185380 [compost metagenome]